MGSLRSSSRSPAGVSRCCSQNSAASSGWRVARLTYTPLMPTKGAAACPSTAGMRATPKSMPTRCRFTQDQGPLIIIATRPCAMAASISG